ncbi:MAG: FAD-binding oxidoreductase [Anaerolineae bacterium]|nr:FAD-binding oxidoreductase [Anaerolineae bacterium]
MSTTANTNNIRDVYIHDVVVVGAGLVGALIARELADADYGVAVLEAREQPGGLAKHSVGLALQGTPEPYMFLARRAGDEIARQVWRLTQENLDLLAQTLEHFQQSTKRVGSLRLTGESTHAHLYQDSVDALNRENYAVTLEDASDYGYLIGINTQDDLSFSPQALTEALLDHPNIDLQTQAEVQEIRLLDAQPGTPPQLAIWAHKHYLRARQVVLTGGAHVTRLSRSLGSVIHPQLIQSIDIHTSENLPLPLLLNDGHIVIHPDSEYWRLAGWRPNNEVVWSQLVEIAQQFCPRATVTARHSAWVAQSNDGFPVVGAIPEIPKVYAISGLGPWGLSWVCITVKHLLRLMLHEEDAGFFNLNRLFRKE